VPGKRLGRTSPRLRAGGGGPLATAGNTSNCTTFASGTRLVTLFALPSIKGDTSRLIMRTSCVALAGLCVILAACASTARYEEKLARWVGHPEDELVKSWGPPSAIYERGGRKFITYARSAQANVPGLVPGYESRVVGNVPFPPQAEVASGHIEAQTCTTTFESEKGRITGWRLDGNACRSN
jgi:hypothetical protein